MNPTRRDVLAGSIGGVIAAASTAGVAMTPKRPFKAADPPKPPDPQMPRSGIVYQMHQFCPGGVGGVLDISLDDGAGNQWNAQLRLWDPGAQLTWNQAPSTPDEVVGKLSTWRANVVYWPLAELNGAALRADFTGL